MEVSLDDGLILIVIRSGIEVIYLTNPVRVEENATAFITIFF
jgi:hypothetical protein